METIDPAEKLYGITRNFPVLSEETGISPISNGLINDTYLIDNKKVNKKFILQKINRNVFKEPEMVMKNLVAILDHLAENPDSRYRLLKLVRTTGGDNYYVDGQQDFWRVFEYLENTGTVMKITDPAQAREAARAFGNFIRRLEGLHPSNVYETIRNFHNYRDRVQKLEKAAAEDTVNRKKQCFTELEFIGERLKYINEYYSLALPERIIHSDTKIDNILFDDRLQKAVCVIDLDIAMPGSLIFDYGDMVRSYTNFVREDEGDVSRVGINKEVFYNLTLGFIEETRSMMTPVESDNLLLGSKVVVLVQAIRNLTDFLMGDVYYKIDYDKHNLDRARNQLTLLDCIEKEEKNFDKLIHSILKTLKNS